MLKAFPVKFTKEVKRNSSKGDNLLESEVNSGYLNK